MQEAKRIRSKLVSAVRDGTLTEDEARREASVFGLEGRTLMPFKLQATGYLYANGPFLVFCQQPGGTHDGMLQDEEYLNSVLYKQIKEHLDGGYGFGGKEVVVTVDEVV